MFTLPTPFPRVPLKKMDPSMLVFELDRECTRLIGSNTGSAMITSAATLASYLHRNQTRYVRGDMPRVPYIEHPLRVALRLIRWGVTNADLIAAALLHDVAEDCSAELLELFGIPDDNNSAIACIARLYGVRVAEYVAAVTNPDVESGISYEDHVAELAQAYSPAVLIKASDLKDNAGSIRHQLGHGHDKKLIGMLRKYRPVVGLVAGTLTRQAMFEDVKPSSGDIASTFAAEDLRQLVADLDALAVELGVDG